ncbi:uncharacterized protein LOC143255867 isoform X2 [Tachypleus tridentatus]|uniref:uncharacterized protein LOC143255867 isoform X2 n=1 Tax=Tachypleus tridentatus TaxID=6853 RepID=UPI003FD00ED3
MGSCYSCKSSSVNHSYQYTTVSMEPAKYEDSLKPVRAIPYVRSTSESSFGSLFKKGNSSSSRLPQPWKRNEIASFQKDSLLNNPKNLACHSKQYSLVENSSGALGNNRYSLSSGTSASTKSSVPQSEQDFSGNLVSYPDNNLVQTHSINPVNNLNNLDTVEVSRKKDARDPVTNTSGNAIYYQQDRMVSNSKYKQQTQRTMLHSLESHGKYSLGVSPTKQADRQLSLRAVSRSCPNYVGQSAAKENEKGQCNRIRVHSFQKPTKLTAHITGLPQPQVPQFLGHQPQMNLYGDQTHSKSHESSISDRLKSTCTACTTLQDKNKKKNQLSSSESSKISKQLLESNEEADSSYSSVINNLLDKDSGIGNSFAESENKGDDSDTLKDVEHFDSFESSPVSQDNSSIAFSSVETSKISEHPKTAVQKRFEFVKERSLHHMKNPSIKQQFHLQKNFDTSLLTDSPGKQTKSSSDTVYPHSYGSYRGLLAYRKIPPLKHFQDIPAWKKMCDSNFNQRRSYEHYPTTTPKEVKQVLNQELTSSAENQIKNKSQNVKEKESIFKSSPRAGKYKDSSSRCCLKGSKNNTGQIVEDLPDSKSQLFISSRLETENKDFICNEEISDQIKPTLCEEERANENTCGSTLQQSVSELQQLQTASTFKQISDRHSTLCRGSLKSYSDIGSSCSSLASDDLMLDFEKSMDNIFGEASKDEESLQHVIIDEIEEEKHDKFSPLTRPCMKRHSFTDFESRSVPRMRLERKGLHTRADGLSKRPSSLEYFKEWRHRSVSLPLRPPRQLTITEGEDGSMKLDASSYRVLCQDLNSMKTMLLRLKRVLQESETLNPFEAYSQLAVFYPNSSTSDSSMVCTAPADDGKMKNEASDLPILMQENADLRRQLVLLQQQLKERDCTIHLLQQQMTKYTAVPGSSRGKLLSNSTTQTDKPRDSALSCSLSEESNPDGSLSGLLVSDMQEDSEISTSADNTMASLADLSQPV